MGSSSNGTSVEESCRLHADEYVLVVLYVAVGLLRIVGNVSILYIFGVKRRKEQSVTQFLLVCLSVVDLTASMVGPCLFVYWTLTCHKQWHFGSLACKVLPTMNRSFVNMSVCILLLMLTDRYLAICKPFLFRLDKRRVTYALPFLVALSVMSEYNYALACQYTDQGCVAQPQNPAVYITSQVAVLMARDVFSLVCFTCVSFSVWRTFCERRRFSSLMLRQESATGKAMIDNKEEIDGTRVVGIVVVMQTVFLVLILPKDIVHTVFLLSWRDGNGIVMDHVLGSINSYLNLLQTANSCANVVIYAKLHTIFRDELSQIVNSRKTRSSQSTFILKRKT